MTPTPDPHPWRKSSRSGASDNCVEVTLRPDSVGVRNSKDAEGTCLRFTIEEWRAFIDGAKAGEFDIRAQTHTSER